MARAGGLDAIESHGENIYVLLSIKPFKCSVDKTRIELVLPKSRGLGTAEIGGWPGAFLTVPIPSLWEYEGSSQLNYSQPSTFMDSANLRN